jgi:hypothetical protein
MVFCIEKPYAFLVTLLSLKLVVYHPHCWFEGELVIYLGLRESCCFTLYTYIFCFSLVYLPKSLCFTCYTSLYLINYAYHCDRMSSNEM